MSTSDHAPVKQGFTLPELVVVVAIVAVLVVLVFPSFAVDAEKARAAVCLGNMHQWGLAISLYCEDWNDYFPYEGLAMDVSSPLVASAWFNVVPKYIHQERLKDLYAAGTPPTPRMKSIWTCPSATNVTVTPVAANPYFMYAFNSRMDPNGGGQFRRAQLTSPGNTILFAEGTENQFPNVDGKFAVARHSGGSNFVLCDGHAEWLAFQDWCRAGNPGCASTIDNSDSSVVGDWRPAAIYHWFPFKNAPS